MQIFLSDAQATRALGERLAGHAWAGLVLALQGDLGAGKTTLAQGMGAGLGVSSRVRSPTFQIMAVHAGRLPFVHMDLYRLGDPDELLELGLEEHLSGVTLIEWAERFPEVLPADHVVVHLVDHEEGRMATLRGTGERCKRWLQTVEAE